LIILDHLALASKPDSAIYPRDYLKFYLSASDNKATVSNEVWEAFRWRINEENKSDQSVAEEIIAVYRGIVEPEVLFLNDDFTEKEPTRDYTDEELVESTKELIQRKRFKIKYFITDAEDKYRSILGDVYSNTVEEFYYHCMGEMDLIEEFNQVTDNIKSLKP